ncbi:MAG: hypothetical protein EOP56_08115 [Sphingobacteriales bacterium]|nr:MAG: hypothetical protein EOP56_08115 [Sphingobacteriales bacterium]
MERFSERVSRYVGLIKQFKYQQAFNEFYDEDLTRIQNVGKWTMDVVAYKARVQNFLNDTENRCIEVKNVMLNEQMQMSIVEYRYSLDHKEKGHLEFGVVAVQRWQDGRVMFEKLYATAAHKTEGTGPKNNVFALTGSNASAYSEAA